MGRKSFTCLSTPFSTHPRSLYSVNSLWEELQGSSNSNIRGKQTKQKTHVNKQMNTYHLKKQPSGNYISTLPMLRKPSDLNQTCGTGTFLSHPSQNILQKRNHEYSMSESPLGVPELLKVVCPCKGTPLQLPVICILPSLLNTATYTTQGQISTVKNLLMLLPSGIVWFEALFFFLNKY